MFGTLESGGVRGEERGCLGGAGRGSQMSSWAGFRHDGEELG